MREQRGIVLEHNFFVYPFGLSFFLSFFFFELYGGRDVYADRCLSLFA